ncbi:flagellar hook-basal body protein [Catenovulum sediminis]|uniref:flagellar hook-basal body protein n=1 Tax=Catenovulum sediminis TaxID=1740262 RepID=UPI0011810DCF|nr:flagellar hook-basal body complex protein [Catenovulum sediminis]
MIEALQIAQTGLKATQEWLDVISNNISNMQTAGFKKSGVTFTDLVKGGQEINQKASVTDSESTGLGTQLDATYTNFSAGSIQATGQALDFAISGNGFLEVQLADGQFAYTRLGKLAFNQDGRLVTASGYPLSDSIYIPPDVQSITILPNGSVEIRVPGNQDSIEVGQLNLATFNDPQALTSMGQGLYTLAEGSELPTIKKPGEEGAGSILQGFVEGSNVDLVEEMTSLVLAQRAYQLNARLVQVMDSIMETTNNIRR